MRLSFILLLFLSVGCSPGLVKANVEITWQVLSSIPPVAGHDKQPGLAGAFVGIHNNTLIIAGGANFPNGPAWEGGRKVFHDEIFILERDSEGQLNWIDKTFRLERNAAYGISLPTPLGIFCAGGTNGQQTLQEAFLLRWDIGTNQIESEPLPPLPTGAADMAGGIIGSEVYIAASDPVKKAKYFWRLDLDNIQAEWVTLPTWPGKPRTHAVGVVQSNGERACFYLFRGRMAQTDGISELYNDDFLF